VPEIKIGIQLASLRQPFRKAVATAAQLGASAVEIDAREQLNVREMTDTALRQVRKLLDDNGLKVCALSFRTRSGYNVVDRLPERIEATKRTMDLAYRLGASHVVNQIGLIPETCEGPEWDMLIDVLSQLGKYSQRAGAFLAAETGSESSEVLAKLLAALPEGSIGVTLNPGNLIVNSFSASEALTHLGQNIMYVRAKDGVRDLAQGRGLEVPLGRGSVDFPEIIGRLEEFGYRGFFTVLRENSTDPVNEIAMSVEYLKNI
jgi:sugar phosphate isomerase/epimerase